MDDFIVNNEMWKASILWNETFHSIGWMLVFFIINNEILRRFWDIVVAPWRNTNLLYLDTPTPYVKRDVIRDTWRYRWLHSQILYLDSEQILQSQTIPSLPRPRHFTTDVIDDTIGDVLTKCCTWIQSRSCRARPSPPCPDLDTPLLTS
jgi:hypothetical protein